MSSPPASRPLPTEGPSAGGDELDDLFDYEIGGEDDPFADSYKVPNQAPPAKESISNGKSGAGLGIDEEVEVTRKSRAPRVKLDEHRLLSAAGIPKLRKRAKDHLKFKGRGHEYSDASKLLAFYQLWLDDLFPKARFLDALAMVEKMGHKRQMQIARMEWINEGRPKPVDDSIYDDPAVPEEGHGHVERSASRIAPIFEKSATERPKTPTVDADAEMDDLYDATPRAARQPAKETQDSIFGDSGGSLFGPAKTAVADDAPPEDDLDALLAEQDMMEAEAAKPVATIGKTVTPEDNFDDEMEAMAEMDGMWALVGVLSGDIMALGTLMDFVRIPNYDLRDQELELALLPQSLAESGTRQDTPPVYPAIKYDAVLTTEAIEQVGLPEQLVAVDSSIGASFITCTASNELSECYNRDKSLIMVLLAVITTIGMAQDWHERHLALDVRIAECFFGRAADEPKST